MKKKNLLLSAVLFLSILPIILFVSCDRDTNCYLEVQVVDSDKTTPISNAWVKIHQNSGTLINDSIIVDEHGIYNTKYAAPGIIQLNASTLYFVEMLDFPIGERRGETSVRLVEGETVVAKIIIKDSVYYFSK